MTTEERIQAIHDVMTDWSTYDGLWLRKALKSAIEDYDHEFVDMLHCIEPSKGPLDDYEIRTERLSRF
jgi:hypothetical protein